MVGNQAVSPHLACAPVQKTLVVENLFRVIVIAIAAAVGWGFNAITDHEVRIVKIEANRFTSQDGQRLIAALEVKLQVILDRLARNDSQTADRLARTETKVDEMKSEIRRLLEKIDK